MKKLIILCSAVVLLGVVISCKTEDDSIDTTRTPTTTCSDFSPPSVPGGATTQPLLVIRIQWEGELYDSQYRGDPFEYTSFQSDACTWAKKFFYNDAEGRLNHYFNEVSNNQFHLVPATETHDNDSVPDGIITVTLPGNHPNPGSSGSFHQKLVDAITIADPYVDFGSFDVSNDGTINRSDLQVMFLVAGYESATGTSPGVWAHKWCIGGQEGVSAPILDGYTILGCSGNQYSRFGERHYLSGQVYDATIGIIAHELGHAVFGLPDLYATVGNSAGIGNFGLMGAGSWGLEYGEKYGESPVHPTAWTKTEVGWFNVTNAVSSNTYSLYSTAHASYNIIKIDILTDASEYFLVENRGTVGYDQGLYILSDIPLGGSYQGGIAIWHIDASKDSNDDYTHKLVDLEEADYNISSNGRMDDGDHSGKTTNLFWNGNATSFAYDTTPDSKDYNGAGSTIAVTGITTRDVSMDITVNF